MLQVVDNDHAPIRLILGSGALNLGRRNNGSFKERSKDGGVSVKRRLPMTHHERSR